MADEQLIRPRELPPASTVFNNDAIMTDDGVTVSKATPVQIVDAGAPVPSQAEAIAGTNNTKRMTPAMTKAVLDNTSAPAVVRAQAWAESPSQPDPLIPGSKSSKTWAGEAATSAGAADISATSAAASAATVSGYATWLDAAAPRITLTGGSTEIQTPGQTHSLQLSESGSLSVRKESDDSIAPIPVASGGTGGVTHAEATTSLFALSVQAAQSWTALQKRNGRKNVAAVGYEADSDITDAMKAQARANIGAAWSAEYSGWGVVRLDGPTPVTLPAGGRWKYFYLTLNTSSGAFTGTGAGVAAGGSTVATLASGAVMHLFRERTE